MSYKVLVVDDDSRARDTVVRLVEADGGEALVAKSGYEAIRIARAERPSAIVLDGLLPEMHGFEVSRYIRTIPDYHPLIVLVTAIYKNSRYESEARLKYGVDWYLTKPVDASALAQVLALHRMNGGEVAQPPRKPAAVAQAMA